MNATLENYEHRIGEYERNLQGAYPGLGAQAVSKAAEALASLDGQLRKGHIGTEQFNDSRAAILSDLSKASALNGAHRNGKGNGAALRG
ncbi:MAG: hypothetical protein KGI00_03140 [Candidatus Micrarchaeota archaeon]|nr:hypothetical protein [Candidatus Micrarchaeota archaeon]MDE1824635.1 hypothetical protein [Candidatus Micrarchaeota archaeon]MDE1849700.1 hypothetical protein [Candidatus Micrarchaeota archaeon]